MCSSDLRLLRDQYRGPVYASEPTIALLGLLLPDAGHLEEEQAEYANRKGYARHQPALPLYTARDADRALRSLRPLPVDRRTEIDDVLSVTLRRALGSNFDRANPQKPQSALHKFVIANWRYPGPPWSSTSPSNRKKPFRGRTTGSDATSAARAEACADADLRSTDSFKATMLIKN